MGETRDRLMNDVRIAGNQAVGSVQERVLDSVQEVAELAVETVMDKVQGVMPKSGGQPGTSSGSQPRR